MKFLHQILNHSDLQLRIEVSQKYETQRMILQSQDQTKIDCFLIYSDLNQQSLSVVSSRNQNVSQQNVKMNNNPVILFCNPNAGYYECMYYETDWIDFYLKKNINVMMWNYRGYGFSEGVPTPSNIQKDGLVIYDFLRQKMKFQCIGIHGESMGGSVAVYIASNRKIDLLIADRTFASLNEVAQIGFGAKLAFVFQLVANWNYNSSAMYIKSNCYKCITFDPSDEVIPLQASLKNGVVTQICINQIDNQNLADDRQTLMTKILQYFFKPVTTRFNQYNQQRQIEKIKLKYFYREILCQNEFNKLFKSLKRIHSFVITLQKLNKEGKIMQQNIELDNFKSQSPKNKFIQTSDNFQIDFESLNDLDKNQQPFISTSSFKNQIQIIEESESYENINDHQITHDLLKFSEQVMHIYILNNLSQFQVYHILNLLDAGGLVLLDIFQNHYQNQKEVLQSFFTTLEKFGSYLPIQSITEGIIHQRSTKKYGLIRFSQVIEMLDNLIQQQKNKSYSINFQYFVINDLKMILCNFQYIYEKFKLKSQDYGNIDISLSNQIMKETKKIDDFQLKQMVGNLIPLSCGHNGWISEEETQIFTFHLKEAGFIKSLL